MTRGWYCEDCNRFFKDPGDGTRPFGHTEESGLNVCSNTEPQKVLIVPIGDVRDGWADQAELDTDDGLILIASRPGISALNTDVPVLVVRPRSEPA